MEEFIQLAVLIALTVGAFLFFRLIYLYRLYLSSGGDQNNLAKRTQYWFARSEYIISIYPIKTEERYKEDNREENLRKSYNTTLKLLKLYLIFSAVLFTCLGAINRFILNAG